MPGENIQDWSTTAASNSNSDSSINWAEGQPRASVNNSARSMMAAHAKQRNLLNGSIVTGGTANAQTFTSGVTYTAPIPTGLRVLLKIGPSLTNTTAATLEMDGLGAVAIKNEGGTDLSAGDITAGHYVDFLYNGTNWILIESVGKFSTIVTQAFTASGTYTPTAGMKYCIIECIGGGGGGGGAQASATHTVQGGGGGGGGYSRLLASAATIGASQAVTIGAGGTSNGNGTATSVGTLCIANGGSAGGGGNSVTQPGPGAGALAAGAVGNVTIAGTPGGYGMYSADVNVTVLAGCGAAGPFGGGGQPLFAGTGGDGNAPGAGGAGGHSHQGLSILQGGSGFRGGVIITEYV